MLKLLFLFLFVCLLIIAYQDFKYKSVSWLLFPVLLIISFFISVLQIKFNRLFISFFYNFSFITLQLIILTIYFSLKKKRFVSIINNFLGLGDVLFLIAVAFLFLPVNFILFNITGFFFTLLIFSFALFGKSTHYRIPLAGTLSFLLNVLIVLKVLFNLDFLLNESIFFQLINRL